MSSNSTSPGHLASDYVHIGLLAAFFIIGFPLNCYSFLLQIKKYRLLMKQRKLDLNTSFLFLRLHLNTANMLLLVLECPANIIWLAVYQWRGGDALCRMTMFGGSFSYHLSSFMVVAIAVERLRNVLKLTAMKAGKRVVMQYIKPVKIIATTVWSIAFLCCLPQFFNWEAGVIEYEIGNDTEQFSQCSTRWEFQKHLAHKQWYSNNSNGTAPLPPRKYLDERIFLAIHMGTIFWVPFFIITICYIIIITNLIKMACQAGPGETPLAMHRSAQPPQQANLLSPTHNCTKPNGPQVHDGAPQTELLSVHCPSNGPLTVPLMSIPEENGSRDDQELDNNEEYRPQQRRRATSFGRSLRLLSRRGTRSMSIDYGESDPDPERRLPRWRRYLHSKMFKSTLLVVLVYILTWLPYNFMVLMSTFSADIERRTLDYTYFLKDLALLSVVINPFLYEFRQ